MSYILATQQHQARTTYRLLKAASLSDAIQEATDCVMGKDYSSFEEFRIEHKNQTIKKIDNTDSRSLAYIGLRIDTGCWV